MRIGLLLSVMPSFGRPAPVPTPPELLSTTFEALTGVTPGAGWGMIKRNPDYTGPALRVCDGTSATEMDIDFDAHGFVRGALPYAQTNIVKVYDQWGDQDLIVTAKTDTISVLADDANFNCWRMDFNIPTADLYTVDTIGAGQPYAPAYPVWASGIIRDVRNPFNSLRNIWGIGRDSFYMEIGLWEENQDLHWRVNGSDPSDWALTNWDSYPSTTQNVLGRCVADCAVSGALGYYNGTLATTRAFSSPVDYQTNRRLHVARGGMTVGNPWAGQITEIHVMSADTGGERVDSGVLTTLDNALNEANTSYLSVP